MNFGNLLREQRIKSNLTLEELANKTGISVSYLSRLENGIRVNPSIKIIQKIYKVLRVSNINSKINIPINIIDFDVMIADRLLSKEEKLNLQKCINKMLLQK